MVEASDRLCPPPDEQQSKHSPSPVDDDERLARLIYIDEHVDDETGELKLGAFQLNDLIKPERRGYSFTRISLIDTNGLEMRGANLVGDHDNRRFRGAGIGSAREIREIRNRSGQRALCVIDDGQPNDPAHALATRSAAYNSENFDTDRKLKPALMQIRESLLRLFSPVRAVEEIFSED